MHGVDQQQGVAARAAAVELVGERHVGLQVGGLAERGEEDGDQRVIIHRVDHGDERGVSLQLCRK